MVSVLILGNPILDLNAVVDATWLQSHDISEGGYTEYNRDRHGDIYDELKVLPSVSFVPGGAGQNTARTVQALMSRPRQVCYIGSVGNDEFGSTMRKIAVEQGLEIYYEVNESAPTGKCAVLVNEETRDRSMCTDLGAANLVTEQFLDQMWEHARQAQILFSAGFVATSCPGGMSRLAKLAASHDGKLWGTNLCAPFIVEMFTPLLKEWLTCANFIVGNETEWIAVQKALSLPAGWTLVQTIEHLCRDFEWANKPNKLRALIVTQGAEPTLAAWRRNPKEIHVNQFPVEAFPKELIVDTNGCGDCFIGGFIAGLTRNLPFEKCVELGHICGREVLQNCGAIFDLAPYRDAHIT